MQVRYPWVISALEEKDPEKRSLSGADLLPGEPSSEKRLAELQRVAAWLKQLPFAGRPLCKVCALQIQNVLQMSASVQKAKGLLICCLESHRQRSAWQSCSAWLPG